MEKATSQLAQITFRRTTQTAFASRTRLTRQMENRAHDEDLAGCRILLIAVPALGDVLLCTPLLRALRAAAGTEIDVLVRRGHAEVLEGNPDVGRIIQVDRRPSVLQHVEMSR